MSATKARYAVYGAGGFGREVLPMVRANLGRDCDIVFIDDRQVLWQQKVNGVDVMGPDQALSEGRMITVAIANPAARKAKCEMLASKGAQFFAAHAREVVIYDHVAIGEGSVLCANVVATSNIRIGKQFHANVHCYIAHDCVIGDYVTFAPHVSCGGRLIIEDGAYIGMGAVIKQGTEDKPLRIGKGALIGMGAVVTKDVLAGTTVMGNPARTRT